MVSFASLFSQVLHHFPRAEFAALVKKHGAEDHAKGFTSWAHFVAMIFCHLAAAESLPEITWGLQCCLGKLRRLGILRPVTRSTLSYANQHRPAELFQDLFWASFKNFQARGGFGNLKHKFRFKNPLLSLDATVIPLCLSLFPWARFRRAKGGVKANVLLDHANYMQEPVDLRVGLGFSVLAGGALRQRKKDKDHRIEWRCRRARRGIQVVLPLHFRGLRS